MNQSMCHFIHFCHVFFHVFLSGTKSTIPFSKKRSKNQQTPMKSRPLFSRHNSHTTHNFIVNKTNKMKDHLRREQRIETM